MSLCRYSYDQGYRNGWAGGFLFGVIVTALWTVITLRPFG